MNQHRHWFRRIRHGQATLVKLDDPLNIFVAGHHPQHRGCIGGVQHIIEVQFLVNPAEPWRRLLRHPGVLEGKQMRHAEPGELVHFALPADKQSIRHRFHDVKLATRCFTIFQPAIVMSTKDYGLKSGRPAKKNIETEWGKTRSFRAGIPVVSGVSGADVFTLEDGANDRDGSGRQLR